MTFNLKLTHPRTGRIIHSAKAHHITAWRPVIGGQTELSIRIPLVFAPLMNCVLTPHGIRTIYGLTGILAEALLSIAVNQLEDLPYDSYERSHPSETDVRHMLINVINLSRLGRRGIWQGD